MSMFVVYHKKGWYYMCLFAMVDRKTIISKFQGSAHGSKC